MNIASITNTAFTSNLTRKKDKTKTTKTTTIPMNNDSFDLSKKELNLDDMSKMLVNIKDKKGKEKFHQGQIATLEYYLKEEPKKWDSVFSLAKNKEMNGDFVYLLASKPLEHLNLLTDIANIKNNKNEEKYSGKEIMNFADNVMFEDLQKAKSLTKTSMPVKNIILLAQTPNLPPLEKVTSKILDMEKVAGKELENVQFTLNKYKKNEFVLTANLTNKQQKTELLDKDLKRLALEDLTRYTKKDGKEYIIKKTTDYRNNVTSKVRLREDAQVRRPVFENEVRIVKDKSGKIDRYEYISPSKVNGVFDISYQKADGTVKKVSSATVNKKTGITSIKKDMTSPDGTRTQYLYENDPQGNRIVDYKITDKNGNVLLNKSQTLEVINENKYISSKNNEKYEINVSENSISVQDLKNKNNKVVFNADKEFTGNKKQILSTLKQLTGEELIKLRKTVDTLESIDDSLDSFYNGANRSIYTGDSVFLFLHELGHAVDFHNVDGTSNDNYAKTMYKSITMDKDVNKAFNEEKERFFAQYPEAQREHMDYFMNTLNHYNGEVGGLGESIAESNAILSTGASHEALAIRSQYFQQNFPKTIAILETKLNK